MADKSKDTVNHSDLADEQEVDHAPQQLKKTVSSDEKSLNAS